ncbi:hypothetical protein Hte_010444 [Hypoxylon texense]
MSDTMITLVPSDPVKQAIYKKNERSSLLALPQEIRLHIFKHVVAHDGPIYPQRMYSTKKFGHLPPRVPRRFFDRQLKPIDQSYANLQVVSRQIYHELESTGVFYEANELAFSQASHLHEYLAGLSQNKRDQIRNIRIQYHLGNNKGVQWKPSEDFFRWYLLNDIEPTAGHIFALLRSCGGLRNIFVDLETQCIRDAEVKNNNPEEQEPEQLRKLLNRLDYEIETNDLPMNRSHEEDVLLGQLRRFEQFRLMVHLPSIMGDVAFQYEKHSEPNWKISADAKVVIDLTASEDFYLERLKRRCPDSPPTAYEIKDNGPQITWPDTKGIDKKDHWFFKSHKHLHNEHTRWMISSTSAKVAMWKREGISGSPLSFSLGTQALKLRVQAAIQAAEPPPPPDFD